MGLSLAVSLSRPFVGLHKMKTARGFRVLPRTVDDGTSRNNCVWFCKHRRYRVQGLGEGDVARTTFGKLGEGRNT